MINEYTKFIANETTFIGYYSQLVSKLLKIRNHVFTEIEINLNIASNKQTSNMRKLQDTSKVDAMALLNERNRKFNLEREKNALEVKKDFWHFLQGKIDFSGGLEKIYSDLEEEYKVK